MSVSKNIELKKYNIEVKKSNEQKKKFATYPVPSFDFGLDYLGIGKCRNENILKTKLNKYVDDWLDNPEKYLKLKDGPSVQQTNEFIKFHSILNRSQVVKFKYHIQSIDSPGRNVATIHLMHWNGRIRPYEDIISLIRKTGIPISTFIHIPAGRGLNPGEGDPPDYDMLSPNIGKTIFRTRQDVQDIQFMAKYLKEELGYREVGLFTYSIGSLRGILASIVNPKLFDFGIFNMAIDDFTEAIMTGVSTKDIAAKIKERIDYKLLKRLWSVISPGAYEKRFSNLPKHTRIIQCKYDFVLGPENVQRFNKKLKKQRPDIELEIIPSTHNTFGSPPWGLKVMWNNLRFIYKHTKMKECKRAKFFI